MDIVKRAVPKTGTTFCHDGIGLEALSDFCRRNLLTSLIPHNGAWPQYIVIGHVRQQDGTLYLGVEIGKEQGILILAGCKAEVVLLKEADKEQNVPRINADMPTQVLTQIMGKNISAHKHLSLSVDESGLFLISPIDNLPGRREDEKRFIIWKTCQRGRSGGSG